MNRINARAELWEANGYVIVVNDRPVGRTMREDQAMSVARWLRDVDFRELMAAQEAKHETR